MGKKLIDILERGPLTVKIHGNDNQFRSNKVYWFCVYTFLCDRTCWISICSFCIYGNAYLSWFLIIMIYFQMCWIEQYKNFLLTIRASICTLFSAIHTHSKYVRAEYHKQFNISPLFCVRYRRQQRAKVEDLSLLAEEKSIVRLLLSSPTIFFSGQAVVK